MITIKIIIFFILLIYWSILGYKLIKNNDWVILWQFIISSYALEILTNNNI